jgi:hypothetical protein
MENIPDVLHKLIESVLSGQVADNDILYCIFQMGTECFRDFLYL